jgi:hypothetical protein
MRKARKTGLKPPAWLAMGTDLAMLGVEAQMVIGQRIAMLMVGGPKARVEAQRMVAEKVLAAGNAAVTQGRARLPDEGAGEPPAAEQGLRQGWRPQPGSARPAAS